MKRKFVDEKLKEQMRELEAKGVKRKAIAKILDVAPGTVSTALGAIAPWRERRRKAA